MLLGVSGSGKSTLLKAFSNKTGSLPPNYQGQLFLPKSIVDHRGGSKPKPIYLVYVSQKDFFHESKHNLMKSVQQRSQFFFFLHKKCSQQESCLRWCSN